MSVQSLALQPVSWSDMVHDPMFAMGYGEIWRGEGCAIDISWMPAECEAYERGRHFGLFVAEYDKARVPLTRAGSIHPRCLVLLCLAFTKGAML